MSFSVRIIADSLGHAGERLTTMTARYPRYLHAEVMTHRTHSRNASSSRAIPVDRLVKMAMDDPATFVSVGKNVPGMQAGEELTGPDREAFEREWLELRDITAGYVTRWSKEYKVHKQVSNRALEPWHHIEVVITASQAGWKNLFRLRNHRMAQPEFQVLAKMMQAEYEAGCPRQLRPGEWHLPYIHDQERQINKPFTLCVWSAARNARVSYLNHEGKIPSPEEDEGLFRRLAVTDPDPEHLSPLEHQAVMKPPGLPEHHDLNGNLSRGWVQFRKILERTSSVDGPDLTQLAHFVNNPHNLAHV